MKKALIGAASVLTAMLAGCAQPLSDDAVKATVARCKELGMATRVFNGLTSFAECVAVKHE